MPSGTRPYSYPVPQNMENFNTPGIGGYTWRQFASDAARQLVPYAGAANMLSGGRVAALGDRVFNADADRAYREGYQHFRQNLNDESRGLESENGSPSSGGLAGFLRRMFGGSGNQEDQSSEQTASGAPIMPRTPSGRQRITSPVVPVYAGRGNRDGGGMSAGSTTLAQRTGNAANDRALESMAEGLMGQSASQRINSLGRESQQAFQRMFGGKEM